MALLCDGSALTLDKIVDNHKKNKWIFDIIDNKFEIEPIENLILQEQQWSLIYEPVQRKLLVVFRDYSLTTLRDLRAEHIPMLEDVMSKVRKKIVADKTTFGIVNDPTHIDFYFHYWPSVYQLHAHVRLSASRPSDRCHLFQHVIRNLKTNSTWYQDALILSCPARAAKAIARTSNKVSATI